MSATLNTTNIKHGSSGSNNIVLNSNGSTTIGGLTLPTSDGTNGQIIKTNGSGTLSFTNDQGGKILQFAYKRGGVTTSSNSGGWTDSVESGLNVDITPTASDSILLIQMHSVGGNTQSGRSFFLRLRRKINNTGDQGAASFQIGDGNNGGIQSLALTHVDVDRPTGGWNTGHTINYRIRFGQDGSGTARFDYATTSVLYVFEIAA
tara:strand:+ start:3505 stop:4119 length:615 start_codon:yes stop_codon:yes gene_type:complete